MKYPLPTRSTALASTVLVLSALALGACAGNDNNTGAAGGGTLTIQGDAGNPQLVENFNPLVLTTELHGAQLIYEPLEIRSPIDGSFTPYLATGHTFKNPTTVVFTIRQGVTWSDGKPFTPQDVVFTYNLLKKYPALDSSGIWTQIKSVSASSDSVTVTFKQPNVPYVGVLASQVIVPQHLWANVADPVKFANTKPVGTGPFTLDTFAPTQYSLKKNPDYWQADKIAPTEVVMPAQSSNQSTNQLDVTSGKFDWSYNYLPDVKKTYVSKDPQHNIYWFPPGGTIGLFLNLTKPVYQNVDFRRGISLALNRDQIAEKAVNGYTTGASQSGLILPNLAKWLDPNLPSPQGNVAQDTSAALKEFQKAGYSQSGGKLVDSSGNQVSMSIMMPANYSDWVAAGKEVVNQLSAIGIKVTLDTPQATPYTSATQSGKYDAALGGYGGTGDPYTDFNNALNSAFAAPVGTATGNNFERYKSPAADQALATLAGATDKATQLKETQKLEQIMYNQVPIVLMYYGGSWGLFSTKNFTGWPSEKDPYTLPTSYNNAILTVVTHLQNAS
jgi:peptide/nickel transport system substrate-binding protein